MKDKETEKLFPVLGNLGDKKTNGVCDPGLIPRPGKGHDWINEQDLNKVYKSVDSIISDLISQFWNCTVVVEDDCICGNWIKGIYEFHFGNIL